MLLQCDTFKYLIDIKDNNITDKNVISHPSVKKECIVNDIMAFFEAYAKCLDSNEHNHSFLIKQKNLNLKMLKFDLDMEFNDKESFNNFKECEINILKTLLIKLHDIIFENFKNLDLNKIFQDCFITTKKEYNIENLKLGYHILFTNFYVPTEIYMFIFNIFNAYMETFCIQNKLIKNPNDNIINKNWFVYGSNLKYDNNYHKIKYRYVYKTKSLIFNMKEYSTLELVQLLTPYIHNNVKQYDFTEHKHIIDIYKLNDDDDTGNIDDDDIDKIDVNDDYNSNVILKELKKLKIHEKLKLNCMDDYNNWMNIGYILCNISNKNSLGFQIWKSFSSISTKYNHKNNLKKMNSMWESIRIKKNFSCGGLLKFLRINLKDEDYKQFTNCIDSNNIKLETIDDIVSVYLERNNKFICLDNKTMTLYYLNNKDMWTDKDIKKHVLNEFNKFKKTIINKLSDKNLAILTNAIGNNIQKIKYYLEINTTKSNIVFNDDKYLFCFNNELFDFEKKEFVNYSYDIYITKYVDYKHDDSYLDKTNKAYKDFQDILYKIFLREINIEYFIYVMTCIMCGINMKKIIVFYGDRDAGKSFLCNIIKKAFGKYYSIGKYSILINFESDSSKARSDLIEIFNSKIAIISEGDDKYVLNSKIIKTLTGDDSHQARNLYENECIYENKAKIILTTNFIPKIDIKDEAVKNRFLIIKFNSKFTNNDNEVDNKRIFKNYNYSIKDKTEFGKVLTHMCIKYFKDHNMNITDNFKVPPLLQQYSNEQLEKVVNNDY